MKKVKFSVPSDEEMLSHLSLGVWLLRNRINRRNPGFSVVFALDNALSELNVAKFLLKYGKK